METFPLQELGTRFHHREPTILMLIREVFHLHCSAASCWKLPISKSPWKSVSRFILNKHTKCQQVSGLKKSTRTDVICPHLTFQKSLAPAFFFKIQTNTRGENNPPAEKVIQWFKTWRHIKGLWLIHPRAHTADAHLKMIALHLKSCEEKLSPSAERVKQRLSVPE